MSCFPCFGGGKKKEKESLSSDDESNNAPNTNKKPDNSKNNSESPAPAGGAGNIQAQSFTFRELATATKHFTPDSLMGDSGFLRVYKGVLEGGQPVVVKQLDRNSLQGKEFLVEVLTLSLLHHPNLVDLVGYCADGDQRLLVYEFMNNGSLKDHLLEMKPDMKPLGWFERMRIAFGAALGLEYLHEKANPPVIYRDFKSSNILLDDLMTPKLSDFGLANLGSSGDKSSLIPSGVTGTYGYSAPECSGNGHVTLKSDVYSFGVVLLELITGRNALDPDKPANEQNLVQWAQPMFREQKRYVELVDPKLQGDFTLKGLNQAVAIAAMCLQEESSVRPQMSDVVITLSFLMDGPPVTPEASPTPPAPEQTPPAPQPPPQRSKPSSSSSDEHVIETLQLGRSKHSPGSKPASRSSSGHNSSRHGSGSGSGSDSSSSSSKHSSRHSRSSISKQHDNEQSKEEEGSDGSSSSSSSKHSKTSSKYGSGRFLSMKLAGGGGGSSKHGSHSSGSRRGSEHESDGSVSRHSESECEYESD